MPDSAERLPCGCRMYTVGDTFVFEPHALDCEYYLYVVEQSKQESVELTYLDMG